MGDCHLAFVMHTTFLVTSFLVVHTAGDSLWHDRKDIQENHNIFHVPYPKNCHRKYAAISLNHTACLKPTHQLVEGISHNDRQKVLQLHNQYRAYVEKYTWYSAADMQKMVWDQELADLAQKWASRCYYDHDQKFNRILPGKYSVGQNIAWTTMYDWSFTMQAWTDEFHNFHYNYGSHNGKPIGHFTQIIWATSTRLGCGYALCNETKHFYVCNYGPTGNVEKHEDPRAIYKPYTIGLKASRCPYNYDYLTGLCDCKGKVCYNGGTLDPYTCTCRCLNRDWIDSSNDCSMNCENAKDHVVCESAGGPWTAKKCHTAMNIPYEYCPITCKFCPVSGNTYFVSRDDISENPWLLSGRHQQQSTTSSTPTTSTATTTVVTTTTTSPTEASTTRPHRHHRHERNRGHRRIDKYKHRRGKENSITTKGHPRSFKDNDDSLLGDDPSIRRLSTRSVLGFLKLSTTSPSTTTSTTFTTTTCTTTTSRKTSSTRPLVAHEGTSVKLCRKVDVPSCGQPSTEGYWPKEYCYSPGVARECPAMCGYCRGQACKDYHGHYYKINQSWVSKFGRLVCTTSGIRYEIGCVRDGVFIADNESHSYENGGYMWRCTCRNSDTGKRLLECTGTAIRRRG